MLNRIKRGIKRLAKSVNDAACAAGKVAEAGINTYGEIKKIKLDMIKSVGSSIKSSCGNVSAMQIGIFMVCTGIGAGVGLITASKIK